MKETTIEEMIEDLLAAGWERETSTRWKCPTGGLYRGPFQAWAVMMSSLGARKP